MYFLYRAYLAVLSFGVIAGALGYKRFDKAARVLLAWLTATWVTEMLAFWMAKQYGNNLPLYDIGNIIQAVLLCFYFNFAVALYRKSNLGYLLAGISVIVGIINLICFQPLNQLATNFLLYTGISVAALCMGSFYVFLEDSDALRLRNQPHFWFMVILSVFWIITLVSWLSFNYFRSLTPGQIFYLSLFTIMANILTYLAIGVVFLFYQKIVHRRV